MKRQNVDGRWNTYEVPVEPRKKSIPMGPLKYVDIGFYLLIPILAGVGLGIYLDNALDKKPIFTIIFIFLGTVSSFYNLWKLTKSTPDGRNS